MDKLYLIKHPEVFQGEKFLKLNKNYFEGWYFKNTNKEDGISFIPGISINGENKKVFIQVITKSSSYFINYNIKDFKYNNNPFYVKIEKNFFSKDYLYIDINDKNQNLIIEGSLKYSNSRNISTNFLNPNIMGPFSYIPFMECNHAILSMKNRIEGSIKINGKDIIFKNDLGYIEKDWGISFPQSYIWCQGNDFEKSNSSFMVSIANIPFKFFDFRGLICDLIIENKEYKFTTYNNSKILKYDIKDNQIEIVLRKASYILSIISTYDEQKSLSAPVEGRMEKEISESISSTVDLILKKDKKIIFCDKCRNCGIEIVKK